MNKTSVLISLMVIFSLLACDKKTKEKKELTDYIIEKTSSVWHINDWSDFDALKQTQFSTTLSGDATDASILLRHLQASQPSLLTSTRTDSTIAYTLIAPQDSLLLPTDSTRYTIQKNKNIYSYTAEDYTFYAGIRDSVILAGTNESIVKEMLDSDESSSNKFIQLLDVKANSEIVGIHKNENESAIAEWSVLDFSQSKNGFLATGVLQSNDTLGYWENLIQKQKPQPIQLPTYTPIRANSAWALVYQNVEALQNQLEIQSGKTISIEEFQILEASDEIGCIQLPNGNALALNSLDNESLLQLLAADIKRDEIYREASIYSVENKQLLQITKDALCDIEQLNWLVVLEDYFVFTTDKDIAKEFVNTKLNKHTLEESTAYKESTKTLSSNASLVYYALDGKLPKDIQQQTAMEIFGDKNTLNKSQFPLITLQLNADKGFSHVNFLAYQGSGQNLNSTRVAENFQIKLENDILLGPIYFSNHSTHRKDIVVQDQTNTLHLFNSVDGKKYWSKKLDSPILGEIHEIDLYKNGRKQLAFATESRLHVLDRNGNEVKPFPIKFKDKVTQGLSVFDYSNNSDYRLVIIQGKEVLMYDKTAKIVRGFEYTKANSNIIMPAQHLRIGSRDYIIFAEENGKLNILDRRGKVRVKVAGKYDIKTQPVEVERGGFVFYTNKEEKINVSTSGTLNRQKLEEPFYKTTKHGVTAFIQSHQLRINQKEMELPFGLYTDPEIYRVGNQTYVTLTDTQENKVYVYNAQGNLLQGFPVYGKALAFLADANRNGKPNLIVQTENGVITQYSVE